MLPEIGEPLWGFTPRPTRGIAPGPFLRIELTARTNHVPPKLKPSKKSEENCKLPTDKHTFISSKFMF